MIFEYKNAKTGKFDPEVWGPHYWFVLHTLAQCYPDYPNDVTKRKYYDFINNLPLFIPHTSIGNRFAELLDKYPVTPYLDKKQSFIRWVCFIHNKVNGYLGKHEFTLQEANDAYFSQYNKSPFWNETFVKKNVVYINFALILALGVGIVHYM
jgi:hypothetical protein